MHMDSHRSDRKRDGHGQRPMITRKGRKEWGRERERGGGSSGRSWDTKENYDVPSPPIGNREIGPLPFGVMSGTASGMGGRRSVGQPM